MIPGDAQQALRDWLASSEGQALARRNAAALEALAEQVDPPASASCPCGAVAVSFDHAQAKTLDDAEVRRRWPRGHCQRCGIVYASAMHYIMGDW